MVEVGSLGEMIDGIDEKELKKTQPCLAEMLEKMQASDYVLKGGGKSPEGHEWA